MPANANIAIPKSSLPNWTQGLWQAAHLTSSTDLPFFGAQPIIQKSIQRLLDPTSVRLRRCSAAEFMNAMTGVPFTVSINAPGVLLNVSSGRNDALLYVLTSCINTDSQPLFPFNKYHFQYFA
jgi:hypothetical protein